MYKMIEVSSKNKYFVFVFVIKNFDIRFFFDKVMNIEES